MPLALVLAPQKGKYRAVKHASLDCTFQDGTEARKVIGGTTVLHRSAHSERRGRDT